MTEPLSIVHQAALQRFVFQLAAGEGSLRYQVAAPGVLDLYHVEVAPALRGKGLAGALVEAACEYAEARDLKLIPTCPYVEWWFQRHPPWQHLLRR